MDNVEETIKQKIKPAFNRTDWFNLVFCCLMIIIAIMPLNSTGGGIILLKLLIMISVFFSLALIILYRIGVVNKNRYYSKVFYMMYLQLLFFIIPFIALILSIISTCSEHDCDSNSLFSRAAYIFYAYVSPIITTIPSLLVVLYFIKTLLALKKEN